MPPIRDDDQICAEILAALEADQYAEEMDNFYLNLTEMDLESCPPDKRFFLGEKEAWVYEHGNICELVFVKT